MSLNCSGSQLLQTPSSPLLAGASTASISIWIRVDPGTSIANPAGVLLFGDVGGKVSVGLSTSGDLRVGWTSNDGKTNSNSSWEQYLLPGVSYHVAATWQDGAQKYYVNGILVFSDTRHGSLGKVGDLQNYPFRLGSDSAGVAVTLDEVTLWSGYALTAADVAGLRDRVGHPEAIAPGSIALQWSLAGPDGLTAKVGDAGLSDASATGLNPTSLVGTAPTYRGGVLSYDPHWSGCTASVCPSGQALLFLFRNEASLPVPVQSLSTQDEIQGITLAGTVVGRQFTLALDGKATAPIAVKSNPPFVYFEWAVTLAGPGDYDIAADQVMSGYNSPHTLYEVFDADKPVGSVVLDLSTATGLTRFGDGSVDGRQIGLNWTALGRFTFASTSARVRVSATGSTPPNATILYADSLRVASADGSKVQYAGPQVPPGIHVNPLAGYDTSYPDTLAKDGGRAWHDNGAGAGNYDSLDAAAVQAALEALPNVGVGNVSVTGNGAVSVVNGAVVPTPLRISFVGTMAKRSVSLLVPSDPALKVSRVSSGGNWPHISINGGPPIALTNPYWGMGHGDPARPTARTADPYLPFVFFPLIQSAPAARYEPLGSHLNTFTDGGGNGWYQVPTGHSTTPWKSPGIGAHATWRQEGLPPDSYRLSATWAADPGNTTDAVYTVTNRAGTVLATYHANQVSAPDGAADQGVPWHLLGTVTTTAFADDLIVTMTNNSAGYMVADSIRFERASADNSVRIAAGDVVTYSSGFGWATTAAGPAAAASGAAVENLVGGTLYPTVLDTPKLMGVGWNINNNYTSTGVRPYTNYMQGYFNPDPDPARTTRDANGYLTSFTGPDNAATATQSIGLVSPFGAMAGYLQGGADVPSGHWTVLWRGTDSVHLSGTEVGVESVAADGSRMRTFDNRPQVGYYSPSINLSLVSTRRTGTNVYLLDVTDLRVYPPGVDPNRPPKYNPGFLAKIRNVQSLRFLDPIGAIASNNVDFADYNPPQTWISRSNDALHRTRVAIAGVTAYPFDGAHPYDPLVGPAFLFTTSTPHQMVDGTNCNFTAEPGPLPLSDGSHLSIAGFAASVKVHSPTTFSCQFGIPRPNTDSQGHIVGAPITMVGTVANVGGQLSWSGGNSFPIQDMVELCNLANGGDGADIYLNTGMTNSDACLTQMGTYLATHLKPGRKVRIEFSNEPWNYYSPPYSFLTSESYAAGKGSSFIPYYCDRAAHHWSLIGAAMAAAGRGGDLIRVLGGCSGNQAFGEAYAVYCAANSINFDAIALAPYISNASAGGPPEAPLADLVDLLTAEQQLDLLEANHTYTDQYSNAKATRSILDSHGLFGAQVVNYEGGPSGMTPYIIPGRNPSRCGERTHAIHRHPRMYHFLHYHLQKQQDAGVRLYHFYYLAGGSDFVQQGGFAAWSAYTATDQPDGTGDPALDAANVATPDRMDLIKSQTGGAINHWGSLVPRSGSPTPPAPKPKPRRPGPIRSTGQFRRPFRPIG